MSSTTSPTWLRLVGVVGVAVLLMAIGVVVGMVWQSGHDEPRTPSTVDIGFAQDMSTHHDQAILMAQTILTRPDISPQIRGLADKIVVAQTAETATMRGWLTWFGEPMMSSTPMAWMETSPDHSHMSADGASSKSTVPQSPMPGMASTDDLTHLADLSGRDAEVVFLQLMIQHHRGGIAMATAAHNSEQADKVTKDLALSMIGDQGDEIGQMTLLLKERDAEPLPTQ